MKSLCTPEIESIMERLTNNIEKQRLEILRLEFYMYMEKQGYPNYWDTCNGIIYPSRDMKTKSDLKLYWFFKFKDGTETRIQLDSENKKFQELQYVDKESD